MVAVNTDLETRPQPPEGITAEGERNGLIAAREEGERGRFRMGLHFNNIVTFRLYIDFGCKTIEEFVEKELKGEPTSSSLRDWAFVAARFTEDQAAALTCHKLMHLLTYAKLKGIENLSNPAELQIEVPAGAEGIVTKLLRDCTTTELEKAIALLSVRPSPASELDDVATTLQQALGGAFGADSHVRVNVARRGRSAVLQVDNLQATEAALLCKLLSPS